MNLECVRQSVYNNKIQNISIYSAAKQQPETYLNDSGVKVFIGLCKENW